MGWWSLLTLGALSALALLGPLLVGNRPLVLKVDGVTRFPVFAGFIPGSDLGLKIEGEPNYRLLAEELKQNGRGWLFMPPVPFAPGEVCEVTPEVSRDADGRWNDPRGPIAEGRIFTLNTDGTRRQAWTIINGRPEGDARLFADGFKGLKAIGYQGFCSYECGMFTGFCENLAGSMAFLRQQWDLA